MASDAIAVPMAPSFLGAELRYILDHSEALVLLSSDKYADKAKETVSEGLQHKPILASTSTAVEASNHHTAPSLRDIDDTANGGLMLYTSGTTSRPVCYIQERVIVPR